MNPLVYILVLNWCSQKDTTECIESVKALDYENFKVLIIDNGSPDGSGEKLQSTFPQYEFIQTGKNLGYAGGNNIGIRHAFAKGADFVWIINPDIRVAMNSLTHMIQAMMTDSRAGVCAPRIAYFKAGKTIYIDGSLYSPDKFEAVVQYVENPSEPKAPVVTVSDVWGCSLLIRKDVFRSIGLFREDFFLYLEETDFNFRAQKNGWKICVCTTAINQHLHKGSQKTWKDRFYFRRNELLLARIHHRFIGTGIIWSLALEKVVPYLKKGDLRGAFWHLRRMHIVAFLAGLLRPIKPIPKL